MKDFIAYTKNILIPGYYFITKQMQIKILFCATAQLYTASGADIVTVFFFGRANEGIAHTVRDKNNMFVKRN